MLQKYNVHLPEPWLVSHLQVGLQEVVKAGRREGKKEETLVKTKTERDSGRKEDEEEEEG